jgi:hypothetical protein
MKKENTVAAVKASLWMRICEFFEKMVVPLDIPPREEKWNIPSSNGDVFEKHWRYSRAHHGLERSMWLL